MTEFRFGLLNHRRDSDDKSICIKLGNRGEKINQSKVIYYEVLSACQVQLDLLSMFVRQI